MVGGTTWCAVRVEMAIHVRIVGQGLAHPLRKADPLEFLPRVGKMAIGAINALWAPGLKPQEARVAPADVMVD